MSAARPVGVAMGASGRISIRSGYGASFAASRRLKNFRMMFMPRSALRKPSRRRSIPSKMMADPARFELTTSAFGGQRSIQLSYGSGARNIPEGSWQRNARAPGTVDRQAPVP
jgi:hypothetical protein